jgi:hypothetical protein
MEQPVVQAPDRNLSWFMRRQGRITTAIVAAAVPIC